MCDCKASLDKLKEQLYVLGIDPQEDGSLRVIQGKYSRYYEAQRREEWKRMKRALQTIEDIASGSTTANSLPNIARLARLALEPPSAEGEEGK